LAAGVVAICAAQPWEEAFAACNATVNGRPMSAELCALATRVYGSVVPGHYWVDDQGNWGRMGSRQPSGRPASRAVTAPALNEVQAAAPPGGRHTTAEAPPQVAPFLQGCRTL
jgi:hypothetical protein